MAVAEVGPDGVRLDNGMRLKNQELLRAGHPAKPRSDLRQLPGAHPPQPRPPGPGVTLCHLYVGASRATSSKLPRTGSTAPPGAPA